MSAICGFWAWGSKSPAGPLCRDMLGAQKPYGPHRNAVWSEGDIAIGHALYALLPEDRFDRQPLPGGGGRYVLAADVRLDNREELAERIGGDAARSPGTRSDSALLLCAIERFGPSAIDLLLGDFAFALWDAKERTLLLARDPLGQRPLYFHAGKASFAFASMPAGLHALPGLTPAPNHTRVAEWIGVVPYLGDAAYYEGLRRVEPAHVVTVSREGVASRKYWRPERHDLGLRSFDDHRDAFREQLDRAVKARLRGAGDVVGTHLSSGWDSSAVTATAARALAGTDAKVVAFTAVPREGSRPSAPFGRISDEGAIAAATAALYDNVEHVRLPSTGASPTADLGRTLRLFDTLLPNVCNYVWLNDIRREARARGAKVILTGELGNWSISASPPTLLADYVRQRRFGAWWREARGLRRNHGARYRGIAASSFAPWLPKIVWDQFRRFSSLPEISAYSAVHPQWRAYVAEQIERRAFGLARRPKDHFSETVRALGMYDYGNLRKGALAGWGVDERDPTADRRLIEFCLSLPLEMLLKDGVRRPLARAALSDRLPAAVLDEKSKGYQAADWHEGVSDNSGEIAALIDEIAADPVAAGLIDVEALRTWLASWPSEGWNRPEVTARYRTAFLSALTAGRFLLNCAERAAPSPALPEAAQ